MSSRLIAQTFGIVSPSLVDTTTYGLSCWQGAAARMAVAHRHDDVEFNLSQTDTEYLIDGKTISFPAGQLAMFWASRPHQLLTETGGTGMSWATVPLAQFLAWRLPATFVSRLLGGGIFRYGADPGRLFETFAQWSRDLQTSSTYEAETVSLELHALSRRVAVAHGETGGADREETGNALRSGLPERMASFIAKNCESALTIGDVAAEVHIHPKYAMALFRRQTGITIGSYISLCRVARAQDLLLTTSLSTAAIAVAAGFQSQTQFHERFKSLCGMSPAVFRRQHLPFA